MNVADLPFLIRLVDDPSPRVREKVARELRDCPDLIAEIARQGLTLSPEQNSALRTIHEEQLDEAVRLTVEDEVCLFFGEVLRDSEEGRFADGASDAESETHGGDEGRPLWLTWLNYPDPWERLEAALGALMHWLDYDSEPASERPPTLSQQLEALCMGLERSGRDQTPEELSQWLFVEKGLRGASSHEYYRPTNSHLGRVITERRGIPISLAVLFMLVGHRLGMRIYGCNFPGHFLAWTREADGDRFYDCFDRGRMLSSLEVNAIRRAAPDATAEPASAEDIVARFLRNLAAAFGSNGERTKARFMLRLLEELESARGL